MPWCSIAASRPQRDRSASDNRRWSVQVQELAAYGVELFLRRGRRVELTDVGTALFDITNRIMTFREEAHDLLQAHGRHERGRIRLATVGPFHATEVLANLRRRYPDFCDRNAAWELAAVACAAHGLRGRCRAIGGGARRPSRRNDPLSFSSRRRFREPRSSMVQAEVGT